MADDAASLALAQRLQAEEDSRWQQAGPFHNRARARSGESLLLRDRPGPPQQRQLLVSLLIPSPHGLAHQLDLRFIALAVTYGIIELIAGCIVLGFSFNTSCDVPLKMWLIVFLLRYCIIFPQEMARYVAHSRRQDELMINVQNLDKVRGSFSFIWTVLGLLWTLGNPAAECRGSSPILWYFCTTIIVMHVALACSPLLLLAMFCMCLPCLLLLLRFFQPNEGMSNSDVRKLPERIYNADDARTENASDACVICQVDFATGDRLRHLPCDHEFHSSCLDQWLVLKATCPLCREHVNGSGDDALPV